MSDRSPSRQTISTSYSTDHTVASEHPTVSTALTIPDPLSPRKSAATLPALLEVFEGNNNSNTSINSSAPGHRQGSSEASFDMSRREVDIVRGPSVKDRASQFEHNAAASSSTSATSRLPPLDIQRTGSTSPLRINRGPSTPRTPNNNRPLPIPNTAPARTMNNYPPVSPSPRGTSSKRSPTQLSRGQGSTKRMVQQWEGGLVNTSSPQARQPTRLDNPNMNRDYLDSKPLPLPMAGPSSTHSSPSRPLPRSPAGLRAPSRLQEQHLQTPPRSGSMPNSPSIWSISSNGEKKRKGGRSPLREMLNVFGGGKLRKHKKSSEKLRMDQEPFEGVGGRYGTSGLPGGIVLQDRMGDQEMSGVDKSKQVIRTSPIIYLAPTPCSSVSPWGSWLTSWATLTAIDLQITYCPLFQDPDHGHSTPKRVFSSSTSTLHKHVEPVFAFSAIPTPAPGTAHDVRLTMAECVEVRSLRKDEVRGRGVPAVPDGIGTEVLEMVWSDGGKRYIGVDGVAGRLDWVSSIWDVLLACKSNGAPPLPPPSPGIQKEPMSMVPSPPPVAHAPQPQQYQPQPRSYFGNMPPRVPSTHNINDDRTPSDGTLKPMPPNSSAPQIHKVGDRWVAAESVEDQGMEEGTVEGHSAEETQEVLRDSIQKMFDDMTPEETPIKKETEIVAPQPIKCPTEINERIRAWQPSTERDLSIFARKTPRPPGAEETTTVAPSEVDRNGLPKSETTLSFDPSDLNPSRSASQVRRPKVDTAPVTTAAEKPMSPIEESPSTVKGPPTLISHVTFPKPAVGGQQLAKSRTMPRTQLDTIPSERGSTIESHATTVRTPQTTHTAFTAETSIHPEVIAKLDSHSSEHGSMSKQIDGVQVDLRHVIMSLSSLVQETKGIEDRREDHIPRALDDKLSTIQMDVKAIENAIDFANLSTARLSQVDHSGEDKIAEMHAGVHSKLDAIAKLCEDVLAKSSAAPTVVAKDEPGETTKAMVPTPTGLSLPVTPMEERKAGDEVAQIMADLTGNSTKNSPRVIDLQVVHTGPKVSSPDHLAPVATGPSAPLSDDTKKQVGEVLGLVKELKEARNMQTQQTTDIARYLNELNAWLEKFVENSTSEIASISKRLGSVVGAEPESTEGEPPIGMPDLVADMHGMLTEQKNKMEEEGAVGQRLDALLQMMGEHQQRQNAQEGLVQQVMVLLDKQRTDNENLLRALATDLTAEIRGERLRFVEAMQQATSMNITHHMDDFKKQLSTEVSKSIQELGRLREERKTLEQQISDLFALKAKHGGPGKRALAPSQGQPQASPAHGQIFGMAPPGQGSNMRMMPGPYGGRI